MKKITSKTSVYPPPPLGSGVQKNFGLTLTAKSFLRLNLSRFGFNSSQILPNSSICPCFSYCQKAMARYFRAASQFAFPFFAEKDLTTKLFSSRQKIYQLVYRLLTTRLLTRYQLGAVLSSGNSEDPITDRFYDPLSCSKLSVSGS